MSDQRTDRRGNPVRLSEPGGRVSHRLSGSRPAQRHTTESRPESAQHAGCRNSRLFHPEINGTHLLPAPGVRCCVALFQPESGRVSGRKTGDQLQGSTIRFFYQIKSKTCFNFHPLFPLARRLPYPCTDSPGAFIPGAPKSTVSRPRTGNAFNPQEDGRR